MMTLTSRKDERMYKGDKTWDKRKWREQREGEI